MISGPTAGEAARVGTGHARCSVRYLEPDGQQPNDHVRSMKNSGPSLMRPTSAFAHQTDAAAQGPKLTRTCPNATTEVIHYLPVLRTAELLLPSIWSNEECPWRHGVVDRV
ncbi:hypothetical protein GGR20_003644 [Devosia subaequoris]|uniref:Uncharacterized protein n=1 Tax=Devosia subaequoris TaxID=395930 RepID=A0A7W6IQH2_9HYPH|nr:hypothetical protein [Devosia subaequoris]